MLRRREVAGRGGVGGGGRKGGKLGREGSWGEKGEMEWTISEKDNEKKRKQDNKLINTEKEELERREKKME